MPDLDFFTCAESTLEDFTSPPCSSNGHSIEHYLHDEIVNEQFTRYVYTSVGLVSPFSNTIQVYFVRF